MTFPQEARGSEGEKTIACGGIIETIQIKISTEATITRTSIEMVSVVLTLGGLIRVRIDLIVVKQAIWVCSVDSTTAFLFRDENNTSNLRSNYKMGLDLTKTSSIRTTNKEGVLNVTLNKANPYPK